ncbi:MAG TPA: hypothetical protein DEQ45_08020 [Agrobacterium sp.]|nr:hypothetical protein CFBP6625_03545 [Agrobacterium tumefaciens]HCD83762.1 hypothetical protein [Agrobacterium sp.]
MHGRPAAQRLLAPFALSFACFILMTGRRILFYVHVKGNRNLRSLGSICACGKRRRVGNSKIVVLIVVNEGLKSNSEVFVKFAAKSLISAPCDI